MQITTNKILYPLRSKKLGDKTASLDRAAGLLEGKYQALKKHYKQTRKGWS